MRSKVEPERKKGVKNPRKPDCTPLSDRGFPAPITRTKNAAKKTPAAIKFDRILIISSVRLTLYQSKCTNTTGPAAQRKSKPLRVWLPIALVALVALVALYCSMMPGIRCGRNLPQEI